MSRAAELRSICLMIAFSVLIFTTIVRADIPDSDCLECHSDEELTTERHGKEISLHVDPAKFGKSIHGEQGCISCHADIEELPHEDVPAKVDCSGCHEDEVTIFTASHHGQALAKGKKNAPSCAQCHGKHDITTMTPTRAIEVCAVCHQKEAKAYAGSTHSRAIKNGKPDTPTCVSCHTGHDVAAVKAKDSPVSGANLTDMCGQCHALESVEFKRSLHGQALAKGKHLAPNCASCHDSHNILPPTDERSTTYVMNIPNQCGQCHKEGTSVSQLKNVAEPHVLEDYAESIHGDGLFQRGLIVTAVCTSCHTAHNILPHENPASSINRHNIAKTCQVCHRQIEKVHTKIINGELWEKKSHQIPPCVDCHAPHKIRRVFYDQISYPDQKCLRCHEDKNLTMLRDGKTISLYLNPEDHLKNSVHKDHSCIKCHTNINPLGDPVCKNSGKVDCSICHAETVAEYKLSFHGQERAKNNLEAPACADCHGDHGILAKKDPNSPTYVERIPGLCGSCHRDDEKKARRLEGPTDMHKQNYTVSIHGDGLFKQGLLVTATCVSCHTAHRGLPKSDSLSSINPKNMPETCGKCHAGIYEQFKKSIHSPLVSNTDKDLPGCNDCHQSHTIRRVDVDAFRQDIVEQCGKCHTDVTETYFDTFHGKVTKLGSIQTAKCYDCHGAHNILPVSNPASTLSRENIVQTCANCHPGSNRKFVGYLTHATHHNKEKYPFLFYTFWFMTALLVGTFSFFGLHTILWLPRAMKENLITGKRPTHEGPYVQRFDAFSRTLHLMVIVSFISLAITGMTIKFSGVGVFQGLSHLLGGFAVTGFIHRVAAVITFSYFILHIGYLIKKLQTKQIKLRELLIGEDSLTPRWRDAVEFWQTVKWFVGVGPRPQYGRWTYWEKFDYFAVFWGVGVIGFSGLILWFPEIFTGVLHLPGWLINVATIVHSDEALLATGFIFTVHFFNTHFRPDKFPMDTVIFTGTVPLEEFKTDRPREYALLVESQQLESKFREGPSPKFLRLAKIFGFTALSLGIVTILLIIYAMVFLYK